MSELAVNINNLSLHYTHPILHCFSDFSLQIKKGERFGLFGPNGAGKTSLMNCMTGILNFQKGNIAIFGKSLPTQKDEIKKLIGFVPQELSFYQELSAIENLEYFGAMYGLSSELIQQRSEELFDLLDLHPQKNKALEKLSGGTKRKVNLAIGVMHQPAILFLDEPTVGVDIQTRMAIVEFLKKINERGTTLVYTSHQLSEAEELCDTIALIDRGKIIAHNKIQLLFSEHQETNLENLFIKLTGSTAIKHV